MGSALVVAIVKYGLLVLLWLFVLAAVRTIRTDLRSGRPARAAAAPAPAATVGGAPSKSSARSAARRLVVPVGRPHPSTLVLTDDYASSRHARLVPGDGAWQVEDLGSTNGTYLGNIKVSRPTPVPLGTQIRIGKTVLELRR